MNLLYIGAGFVGASSAAVAGNSGHRVLVYDIAVDRIRELGSHDRDRVEACLFEKGLGDFLVRHRDRITFTADDSEVIAFLDTCDAVFLCLPTPEIGETGETDLSQYLLAVESLARALKERNAGRQTQPIVIVNKSTVPIGMATRTHRLLRDAGVVNIGVVSNPEFLVEGKAIQGSLKPDRVVVGATAEKDFLVMRQIYQRFHDDPTVQYIECNPTEAEAGKLLANYYLFNKLALCFDVIGRTAETFSDIHFEQLRRILIADDRIGSWGFYNSLYAGGSCLIKDARSLSYQLQTAGQNAIMVNETYAANRRQLELFLERSLRDAGMNWTGKKVLVLGVSFKRDTNDIRNSPSLEIVRFLKDEGVAAIALFDPAGMDNFRAAIPESDLVSYVDHETEGIAEADAVIIATDWPQFRGLAEILTKDGKRPLLLMDGRRMLQHRYGDLQEVGIDIIAVGSPFLAGKK